MDWYRQHEIHEFSPRSPDLTLLNFFLWDYVKDIVYAEESTTREDMKTAFEKRAGVLLKLYSAMSTSIPPSSRCYIQQNGRVFEHLIP